MRKVFHGCEAADLGLDAHAKQLVAFTRTSTSCRQTFDTQNSVTHAHVRLHFYISRDWLGEPRALEGQQLAWQGAVSLTPLLPATIPLIEWLDQLRFADCG